MDLLIPHSWLKKYLDTKAKPEEIAKYLSLCGPSIERVKKTEDGDYIYSIEVTTNRVDTASVIGIAREAQAILPNFKISAKLKKLKIEEKKYKFAKKVKYLNTNVDTKLCNRFSAVLIRDVKVSESPTEIKSLLEKVGVRPINNIVDISNYIMHEIGQPVHTFDYDKISGKTMTLRESKKGELITTLDDKEFKLDGGDIVIEDGGGNLIDLCGIMGGKNSAIDDNTKNVLLFVQNYNQHKIRRTSMSLGQRSEAAVLFEKGLDSENVKNGILLGISLIEKLSSGVAEKEILNIYPSPYKTKVVTTTKEALDTIIGISIDKKDVTKYLVSLGFGVNWNNSTLKVSVPSWRSSDIDIPEDIVEEVARIYGYFNLPPVLMGGMLPKQKKSDDFAFEREVKQVLKTLGAVEVYNLSLVNKNQTDEKSLRLKNPLGADTEYLRTTLKESLIENIKNNPQEKDYIHMFEVANIYLARNNDLPDEKLTLSGVIKKGHKDTNLEYRENKGIIETLLNELNINYKEKLEDGKGYLPNQRLVIVSNKVEIGEYGNLENGLFFYNFDMQKLANSEKIERKYKEVSKFPSQIEDLTLVIPEKTLIGEVISSMVSVDKLVKKVELTDIYENSFTFNIEYHNDNKTLTNKEVEDIRTKILNHLKTKHGISLKN